MQLGVLSAARAAKLLTKDGGAADRGEYRQAAGAITQDLIRSTEH